MALFGLESREAGGNSVYGKSRSASRAAEVAQDSVGASSDSVMGVVNLMDADMVLQRPELAPSGCVAAQRPWAMGRQILEDVSVDCLQMGKVKAAPDERLGKLREPVRNNPGHQP